MFNNTETHQAYLVETIYVSSGQILGIQHPIPAWGPYDLGLLCVQAWYSFLITVSLCEQLKLWPQKATICANVTEVLPATWRTHIQCDLSVACSRR